MNIVSAGLLLFWGIYFAMAGTGNVVDRLSNHGTWRFFRHSSMNMKLMERVSKRHWSGTSSVRTLFTITVSWELLSAVLYVAAFILYLLGNRVFLQYAFFIGMGLFAGLILGNEAFVYYDDVEEHVTMLIAQLISHVTVAFL